MTAPLLAADPAHGLPVCAESEPDLWFAERPADVEAAKALCGRCSVRVPCLAGALRRREATGVWGGQLLVDGAVVATKRGRGRPRKDAVPRPG